MKILLIGETCTDVFQYGKVTRISPEAACMVFTPTYKTENDGMAANVLNNLESLDPNLDITFLTNHSEIKKIRYVDERNNQHIMRQDINDNVTEKYQHIDYHGFSAVVVSDYDKGFITTEDLYFISRSIPISFLDTKKKLGTWSDYFTYIKINSEEFERTKDTCIEGNLIVTLGDKGAIHKGKQYLTKTPSVIGDIAGAGDTFLAGLVCDYLKTKDIDSAISFANICAGKVVQQKGVSVV